MSKARIVILVCFVFVFAAAGAAGFILGRTVRRAPGRSLLVRQLKLTEGQRDQMRKIWAESMSNPRHRQREQNNALEREREERVRGLLTEEQQKKYDEIAQNYAKKKAAFSEERRKSFQAAVEQTKQILTESQRRKYEELLKKQMESRRMRREGDNASGASSHSTSRGGE